MEVLIVYLVVAFLVWFLPIVLVLEMGKRKEIGLIASLFVVLFFSWLGLFVVAISPNKQEEIEIEE